MILSTLALLALGFSGFIAGVQYGRLIEQKRRQKLLKEIQATAKAYKKTIDFWLDKHALVGSEVL